MPNALQNIISNLYFFYLLHFTESVWKSTLCDVTNFAYPSLIQINDNMHSQVLALTSETTFAPALFLSNKVLQSIS